MKEYEFESLYGLYKIRVGESAQENWDLIDDSAQNDVWFHVEGHPSCHVVLSVGNAKKIPHKSVLNYCANLCKDGSKMKNNKNATVIYTLIKNVKKADKPGSVTTTKTNKIKV
jgi:predicted ribosome quality control (RQC) complex YloA/Tae2 family protein